MNTTFASQTFIRFSFVLLFYCICLQASAAARYWRLPSGTGDWSNPANWSATSPTGPGGASVPGPSDYASFNSAAASGAIRLTSTVTVGSIIMSGSSSTRYSFDLNGFDFIVDSGSFTQLPFAIFSYVDLLGASSSIRFNITGGGGLSINNSNFAPKATGSADRLALIRSIFNNTVDLIKTGSVLDNYAGGNTFQQATSITVNAGTLVFPAANPANTYNADVTYNLSNASSLLVNAESTFNGNIIINNTDGSNVILALGSNFNSNGISTLALGKKIIKGSSDFVAGKISIRSFNTASPQNINFSINPLATTLVELGPYVTFENEIVLIAPQITINGDASQPSKYGNSSSPTSSRQTIRKTGAGIDVGTGNSIFYSFATIENTGSGSLRTNGGNTFNLETKINNSGSGDIRLESVNGSTYNGDAVITNSGAGYISMAFGGATFFNQSIFINSTSGNGIYFCEPPSGVSTATLASGKVMFVDTNFSAGELRLLRFSVLGTNTQTIALTGTATFRSGPSVTWNGPVNVTAPSVYLNGNTFNGSTNDFIKTGTTTDPSNGGNTFNGATTFNTSSTSTGGIFRLSNTTADSFNGNVRFNQNGGIIQPAYNVTSAFQGNIVLGGSSTTAMTFGIGPGSITNGVNFTGANSQTVSIAPASGAVAPTFKNMYLNKSGNSVTLNTRVNIGVSASFNTGVVNTNVTNILSFGNTSSVFGGSSLSHVDGPVQRTGNSGFTFPIGDNGIYRPLSITGAVNTTDSYSAEYFKATHPYGGPSTYLYPIETVSTCEYWMLRRLAGIANLFIDISWDTDDCTGPYITNPASLLVSSWNATTNNWISQGSAGTTVSGTTGTVASATAINFSGLNPTPITIASSTADNPLPIELLDFKARAIGTDIELNWITASEVNSDYFSIQRSTDGHEFEEIARIASAHSHSGHTYQWLDKMASKGVAYYRIKQVDLNGEFLYSTIVSVEILNEKSFLLLPNFGKSGTIMSTTVKGEYAVYNNLGVVVMRIQNSDTIDTTSLASGIYIVKNGYGQMQRLIVH
jgi:hypothetical protein